MADVDDRRLEALLRDAATALPYPAAVPLRARVLTTLEVERRTRDSAVAPRRWRTAAVAAAVAAAVVVAGALAAPGARTAVGEFFGIVPGQRVEILPPTSTPASAATAASTAAATPAATPATASFVLSQSAKPLTLEEAREVLPFPFVGPRGAGEPGGVYGVLWGSQPLLILQYETYDLWLTRGSGFFGKGVLSEVVLAQPRINGRDSWWIEPGGHETAFYDAAGREVAGSRRTVEANVLIWQGAATYYRLETELPMEEALAIAETLP